MSKLVNYKFDSKSEEYFYYYLEELYKLGLVTEIKPDRVTFKIFDKVVINGKKIIGDKHYTPDFIFKVDKCLSSIFFINTDGYCYVDVKGGFTSHYTSSMTFPDRQAMVWNRYNLYVEKVIPHVTSKTNMRKCLFKNTFLPTKLKKVFINKSGKSTLKYETRSIKEFIELNGITIKV